MVEKFGKDFREGDHEALSEDLGDEMLAARILIGLRRPCKQPSAHFLLPDFHFDIICNILSHLRPQTLGRMKLVCKAWRDLIESPYFVLRLHLPSSRKYRPCIPFHKMRYQSSYVYVEDNSGTCNALLNDNIHPADLSSSILVPLSTCNGLLCYVEEKEDVDIYQCCFYVINPITREKMELPNIFCQINEIDACELVWDDEESEPWGVYKVLLIYRVEVSHALMFTLGVDCAWRSIFNPYKYWRNSPVGCLYDLEHPRIGGAIHRVYDNTLKDDDESRDEEEEPLKFVAAFDIKEETFREIKLPDDFRSLPEDKSSSFGSNGGWSSKLHLIELRGLLCVLQLNIFNRSLDAWLLVDYDKGMWMRQPSVVIESLVLERIHIHVFAKINDERVLIKVNQSNQNQRHKAIFSYNPEMLTIKWVNAEVDMGITIHDCVFCGGVYTESLVPLNHLSSSETDVSTPSSLGSPTFTRWGFDSTRL